MPTGERERKLEELGYPLDRGPKEGSVIDLLSVVGDLVFASGQVAGDGFGHPDVEPLGVLALDPGLPVDSIEACPQHDPRHHELRLSGHRSILSFVESVLDPGQPDR
jgi:hypothetical protein